jgi:type IV pilus assembly protein PilO
MALLPQEPKQQKALVAILMVIAGAYAFHAYWYTPRAVEVEALETRLDVAETRNRQAQVQAARGGANLEERNALYERHVMELEQLVPRSQEVPQLMRTINEEARRAGVTLSGLDPELDEPGEFYVRQSWTLRLIGEYDDLGRFMTFIASLPRIITAVDVALGVYDQPVGVGMDFQNPVMATFRIELYVLPDGNSGPPPAQLGVGR